MTARINPGAQALTELTPAMRAFLDEQRYAVVATIDPSGAPQQTVVWYMLDGDDILFNVNGETVKSGNLARDPRTSVLFEDGLRMLRVSGRARSATDRAATHADLRRLIVRYEGEGAIERRMATFSKQARVSYRVPARRVYARGF